MAGAKDFCCFRHKQTLFFKYIINMMKDNCKELKQSNGSYEHL